MRAGATGVDHALRDALAVEVLQLLLEVVVLQQHRAAGAGLERMVGLGAAHALRGGQVFALLREVGAVGVDRAAGGRGGLR